jgi:hypothetical protein
MVPAQSRPAPSSARAKGAAFNPSAGPLTVANYFAPLLDMSGLDTFSATVSQIGIGYDPASPASTRQGVCYLARTNHITTGLGSYGNNAALVIGGATVHSALSGGALYLGQTNALYVDGIVLGTAGSTSNLLTFNPHVTNGVAYIRGVTGDASRVTLWSLGDGTVQPAAVMPTISARALWMRWSAHWSWARDPPAAAPMRAPPASTWVPGSWT